MKLVLAGNYRVGSKIGQRVFAAEWQYGMRAGQGVPLKCPATGEPILNRENPAFNAGHNWGLQNRQCRSVQVAEAALNAAWSAYRASI